MKVVFFGVNTQFILTNKECRVYFRIRLDKPITFLYVFGRIRPFVSDLVLFSAFLASGYLLLLWLVDARCLACGLSFVRKKPSVMEGFFLPQVARFCGACPPDIFVKRHQPIDLDHGLRFFFNSFCCLAKQCAARFLGNTVFTTALFKRQIPALVITAGLNSFRCFKVPFCAF